MTSVELGLSQEMFEKLHDAATTRRKQVRVDTWSLSQLLMDYSIMLKALKAAAITVNEPPRRKRPHLNAGAPDLG